MCILANLLSAWQIREHYAGIASQIRLEFNPYSTGAKLEEDLRCGRLVIRK